MICTTSIQYNEKIFERELDEFRISYISQWDELYQKFGQPKPETVRKIYWFLFEEPPFSLEARDSLIKEFINNLGSHLPFQGRGYRGEEEYKQLQKDLDQIIEELQIPNEMLEESKTTGEIFAKLYISMRKKGYERSELVR